MAATDSRVNTEHWQGAPFVICTDSEGEFLVLKRIEGSSGGVVWQDHGYIKPVTRSRVASMNPVPFYPEDMGVDPGPWTDAPFVVCTDSEGGIIIFRRIGGRAPVWVGHGFSAALMPYQVSTMNPRPFYPSTPLF